MARLVHLICFGITFVAFVLNLTANSSSNWWVSLQPHEFERIGLWEICFNHYRHRFDYYGKIYTGCWWHFSPETRMLYSWISTPWYQAVQSFATFSMVTIFVSLLPMFIVTFMGVGKVSSRFICGTAFLILSSGKKTKKNVQSRLL